MRKSLGLLRQHTDRCSHMGKDSSKDKRMRTGNMGRCDMVEQMTSTQSQSVQSPYYLEAAQEEGRWQIQQQDELGHS